MRIQQREIEGSMGDLTTGYSFVNGEQVTHTKLNNAVNLAVINGTFFTGKTDVGANPDQAAYLMMFCKASDGTIYKGAISRLFAHTSLIHDQTAYTTSPSDTALELPIYLGGTNQKATLATLITKNPDLVNAQTAYTAPIGADTILAYDSVGTATKKLTLGNLIHGAVAVTSVAQASEVLMGDGTSAFNRVSVYNLFKGNATAETTIAEGDELPFRDISATAPKRITFGDLFYRTVNEVTGLTATNHIPMAASNSSVGFIQYSNLLAQLNTDLSTANKASAWAVFDGTAANPITPLQSYNVDGTLKITKNGTGDYTINFSTAMPHADYSAQVCVLAATNPSAQGIIWTMGTGSLRIRTGSAASGALTDFTRICVTVNAA